MNHRLSLKKACGQGWATCFGTDNVNQFNVLTQKTEELQLKNPSEEITARCLNAQVNNVLGALNRFTYGMKDSQGLPLKPIQKKGKSLVKTWVVTKRCA